MGAPKYIDNDMKKAVIYARYSSHNQNETSIEAQLEKCYEYANSQNLIVIKEYIDRAKTGTNDDRKEFQKMMKDSEKKQFDFIIVYKLDRFARNKYDSAIYKQKLKKSNNIRVMSALELISDTPEGIMLETMLEGMAEYYSANLSQNIKNGKKRSAENGTFAGGFVPYGFKSVGTQIIHDELKAPIIKEVFELYAQGVPKKEIIERLRAKGIKSYMGRDLSFSSFQNTLKNPKYMGKYLHDGQWYTNLYPPIVDEDTFNKVQKRLAQNARAPAVHKARVSYMLQGKAYCGHCGAPMVGESGKGKLGTIYNYYACSVKKKKRGCDKHNEKKGFLEYYIVSQALEYILAPERIDFVAEQVVAAYNHDFDDKAVAKLEEELRVIEAELEKCLDLALSTNSAAMRKKAEERADLLDLQKRDAEIDLAKLRIANKIKISKKEVKAWLSQFKGADPMDEDVQQRVIDAFVNCVYVYDDKIMFYFNIKDGKQISYIDMVEDLEALDNMETLDSKGRNGVRICKTPLRQE